MPFFLIAARRIVVCGVAVGRISSRGLRRSDCRLQRVGLLARVKVRAVASVCSVCGFIPTGRRASDCRLQVVHLTDGDVITG